MQSRVPRVAVLIPAYNSEETIARCLSSLEGSADICDVVIVDDGSRVPIDSVVPKKDNVFVIRLSSNAGITAALNAGLDYILPRQYEFVARLDADDLATPGRLEKQLAYMDAHSDIVLLGGWGRVVSEEGTVLFYLNYPTDHESILKKSWYNNAFIHPTMMIRAEALRRVGGYREMQPSAAEDYELARRLSMAGRVANIPEYIIDYTYSINGISLKNRRAQLLSRLKVQWIYRNFFNYNFYLGVFETLALWYIPTNFLRKIKMKSAKFRIVRA